MDSESNMSYPLISLSIIPYPDLKISIRLDKYTLSMENSVLEFTLENSTIFPEKWCGSMLHIFFVITLKLNLWVVLDRKHALHEIILPGTLVNLALELKFTLSVKFIFLELALIDSHIFQKNELALSIFWPLQELALVNRLVENFERATPIELVVLPLSGVNEFLIFIDTVSERSVLLPLALVDIEISLFILDSKSTFSVSLIIKPIADVPHSSGLKFSVIIFLLMVPGSSVEGAVFQFDPGELLL